MSVSSQQAHQELNTIGYSPTPTPPVTSSNSSPTISSQQHLQQHLQSMQGPLLLNVGTSNTLRKSNYNLRQLTAVTTPSSWADLRESASSVRPGDAIKTPLYRPAALRPKDYPAPSNYYNAPSSSNSSSNSSAATVIPSPRNSIIPTTGAMTSAGSSLTSSSSPTATTFETSLSSQNSTLSLSNTMAATAETNRKHWKPDARATQCALDECQKPFSLFERKHHCRKCGDVFCGEHSDWLLRLTPDLKFSPTDELVKGCSACGLAYQQWLRTSDENVHSKKRRQQYLWQTGSRGRHEDPNDEDSHEASIGNSHEASIGNVPRDWSWSTF